ncbi:MAG TPA: hypothetical protein VGB21_00325 [Candidatus Methylomirabilis sp.]
MSGLLEVVSGITESKFVSGGGLASILSLVTKGMEGAGSISASQKEAEAIKSKGAQEQAQKEFEAQKLEREKRVTAGRQRALYAKAGVDISAGSPLEVMEETRKEYDFDIAQTRNIGALAYASALKSAKDVKTAGLWKGGPTILTGLSEFANSPLWKKKPSTGGYIPNPFD